MRRAFNANKAGHAGTLDPLASGVLPIALGEATKTVAVPRRRRQGLSLLHRLGRDHRQLRSRRAGDRASDGATHREAVAGALKAFIGEIDQVPPAFSAVKVAGERAYALARPARRRSWPPAECVIHGGRLLAP